MSLADTESLLSQLDPFDSCVDEGTRTPGASSDLRRTDTTNPSSPPTITGNHIHIYHSSVVTTNSNVTGLTVNRGTRNSGG